ncbi:MAG: hypothetical protein NC201_06110 [Prevotella sp.]|nr:hypothetical protein [Bacteroides sp.]MCM1366804.1 hypothetical protein [Prevotella sp.]MCM1437478.1 hypothetical protein [Prevotella sp.]
MKKFYMLLTALIVALSVNAADWYISGGFQNWSHCNPDYQLKPVEGQEGVFSISLQSIYGKFVICQGTVGTPDWSNKIGTNGNPVVADTPYKYVKGGNDFSMDGQVDNALVTLDTKAGTLLISGQAKENEYDTVYLIGDFGSGWSETTPTPYALKLKEGTENVWEGSFTLSAATSYFKMAAGVNVYGTGGDDIAIEMGKEYTAAMSGNAFSLNSGAYDFTFVLDKNAESGKLTVTGSQKMPDTFYVLGNVNGKGWNPTNGVAMTKDAEGVFSVKSIFIGSAEGTPNGYFSFCTELMTEYTEGSAWSVGARYGATSADFAPSFEDLNTIQAGEMAFMVPTGSYNMTVDLNAKTLKIESAPIVAVIPENLYLIGNFDGNSFDPTKGLKLTETHDGVFSTTANITSAPGASYGYFSFCTELMESYTEGTAWNVGTRYGAPTADLEPVNGEPTTLSLGEFAFMLMPGEYKIDVDCNTMSIVVTAQATSYPETVYVIGNINETGWNPTNGVAMTNKGEGVYSITDLEILAAPEQEFGYFSFCTKLMESYTEGESWNVGIRYGASEADQLIDLETVTAISVGENSFMIPAVKKYDITLNLADKTIYVKSSKQSINEIEVSEGEAEYFNLQGIRVAEPANGLYIKVVNGKATKTVIRK